MTKKLLLGSNNKKKREEIAQIIEGMDFELLTLADLESFEEPEENGASFEENARIKAFYYSSLSGNITLADDSGLIVDALDGKPGIHSARFAGEQATDEDNRIKLLKELKGVPDSERTGRFVCTIVVAHEGKALGVSTGQCEGRLLDEKRGENGFGYDPLFFYPPENKTFAELDPKIKNGVSHRAQALKGIKDLLQKLS